jgi:hypothetical protein
VQLTIFSIVNRSHASLTVAMNCHPEDVIYARGGVTVFFAICFSANQIQVFYMKVYQHLLFHIHGTKTA